MTRERTIEEVKNFCEVMGDLDDSEDADELKLQWHRGYTTAMQAVVYWINHPEVVMAPISTYNKGVGLE